MRAVLVLLASCIAWVGLATPATAAPDQVTLREVYTALEVQVRPVDYVVLVDTSASMTAQNRYGRVRSALASMLNTLRPDDRFALVTFDSTAKVRYDGPVGKNPAAALAKLPANPTGRYTDIGIGIASGLELLAKTPTDRASAIALITDGKLDAPGSPYAKTSLPAWQKLHDRAATLGAGHEIAAYALGLINATDATLLHKAFPDAVDVRADQFSERLATLRAGVLAVTAAQKLRPDLDRGVKATWSGIDWGSLPAGATSVPATLTLTSTYEQVPARVGELRVTATDASVTIDAPSEAITLAPGASKAVPVTITLSPAAAAAPATGAATGAGKVTVSASVTSPWAEALSELDLKFRPKLDAPAQAVTRLPASSTPQAPPPDLRPLLGAAGAAVGLAALLTLVGLLVRGARRPLSGSLAISRSGTLVREFVLAGREVTLADAETTGLSGRIRAARGKAAAHSVDISARVDRRPVRRATLGDRQSVEIGDYTLAYTAQHTRSMTMITSGLPH